MLSHAPPGAEFTVGSRSSLHSSSSPSPTASPALDDSQMKEKESWIRSLLFECQRFQNDINLLARPITDAQLKALQTRIHATKLELVRVQRLEALRIVLGYDRPLKSTWDLSMSDAKGLMELENDELNAVFMWALLEQAEGALV